MLSCSRQVAQDMESRCYPGQSLIWTLASEKTHMTHGVCARKQFAMKSMKWKTQALRKSIFLHQYVVSWIEKLRAGGQGVNKWFAKTEMRREWEAMNTAPDRHHEPHGGTNVCYSLFWSSHADNIPTHIHRNIKDNFLAHLFLVCYCHFWSPSPPPLKISCTVLRVVTGETTRGIPKIFLYMPKVLGSWDHGLNWLSTFVT